MWMGSPLLTSSVVKIRRKSCGVNSVVANAGCWSASSAPSRLSRAWIVAAPMTERP